jgi:hypothetical protein
MQNLYPKATWKNNADHLLFDIGFTYGLLKQVEGFLTKIRPLLDPASTPTLNEELMELFEALKSLREGRMQVVNEIYAAADEAAKKAQRKQKP